MTAETRRYFMGLIAFAFVICWATAGLLAAIAGLAACVATISGPDMLARRRRTHGRRIVRARPVAEGREAHQLVPDDPSLVFELG